MAAIASIQSNASGSAMQSRPAAGARVCCRMLTEGGKIHLQSELAPCFCFPCFLSPWHPFSPDPFPSLRPGQLPLWRGCRRGHFHTPQKGWLPGQPAAWPRVPPRSAPQNMTALRHGAGTSSHRLTHPTCLHGTCSGRRT